MGGLLPSGPLKSCGPPEDCLPVPWERRRQKNSLLPLYPLSHHNTDTRAAKTQANFSTNGLIQVQKQRNYSIGGAKAKTEVNLNFLSEPIPREKTTLIPLSKRYACPSPWEEISLSECLLRPAVKCIPPVQPAAEWIWVFIATSQLVGIVKTGRDICNLIHEGQHESLNLSLLCNVPTSKIDAGLPICIFIDLLKQV